jgi:hypothetical protein
VNSWKIILATIVIFGAGVITGGLLVDHVKHPAYSHPPHPSTPPPASPSDVGDMPAPLRAQMLNKQFVAQLNDELQLSKEQREQIQKIIAQGQQSSRDLWKLVGPQFQIISRDTRQQIREVLTAQQRKQFEMLVKQQRHPASTNAPPAQVTSPTNAPVDQPSIPTNGPAV